MEENQKLKIITVLLFLLVLAVPVSALTLTFADTTLQGQHEILVINSTGGIEWQGNSSATATGLPDNETLIVHIKPEVKNILESPFTLLAEIRYQVEANLVVIILIGVVAAVFFGRKT